VLRGAPLVIADLAFGREGGLQQGRSKTVFNHSSDGTSGVDTGLEGGSSELSFETKSFNKVFFRARILDLETELGLVGGKVVVKTTLNGVQLVFSLDGDGEVLLVNIFKTSVVVGEGVTAFVHSQNTSSTNGKTVSTSRQRSIDVRGEFSSLGRSFNTESGTNVGVRIFNRELGVGLFSGPNGERKKGRKLVKKDNRKIQGEDMKRKTK
jgi:hypothetical protein